MACVITFWACIQNTAVDTLFNVVQELAQTGSEFFVSKRCGQVLDMLRSIAAEISALITGIRESSSVNQSPSEKPTFAHFAKPHHLVAEISGVHIYAA